MDTSLSRTSVREEETTHFSRLWKGKGRKRCVIGCSGSVATIKVPELVVKLATQYDILVVATEHARFFLEKAQGYNPKVWDQFIALGGMNLVLEDKDEWTMWSKMGEDVLHIELRRWADVLVIAPASANLIAKASVGISDNLLLSVIRAWDMNNKPCILCPAMNTLMWDHPATSIALEKLHEWGWKQVGPVAKMLACRDVGQGAMASVNDICQSVVDILEGKMLSTYFTPSPKTAKLWEQSRPSGDLTVRNLDSFFHATEHDQAEATKLLSSEEEGSRELQAYKDQVERAAVSFRLFSVPAVLLITAILLRQN